MTPAHDERVGLGWHARPDPLAPRALVASGAAALALGQRLAALDDAALAALTAVAGDALLLVLGEGDALPWVDGVIYLGRDPAAPDLLLPTALAPTIPPAALERAVRAWLGDAAAAATGVRLPIAVVPAPLRFVACGDARAVERARLTAWLADATGSGAPA